MAKLTLTVHIEANEAVNGGGWIARADAILAGAYGRRPLDAIVNLIYLVQEHPEMWEPRDWYS